VPKGDSSSDAVLLSEYLRPVYRDRWGVLGLALACGVLLYVISFLLPPSYLATSTLIPVGNQDKQSLLGQLSSGLEDLGIQPSTRSNSPAMYPEIVRSRRLLEQALKMPCPPSVDARQRPLIEVVRGPKLDRRSWEKAIRGMRRAVSAYLDRRTGVLTIEARAKRPEVAAYIANTLDTLLQDYTIQAFTTQAGANRIFIEGRLAETEGSLHAAEENLRNFREKNLRIGNSPQLLMEETRYVRLLRGEEEVYVTLRRQYEVAKIQEHKELPVLNVLDPAVPPLFRNSPKRGLMGAAGFIAGLVCGSWLALLRTKRPVEPEPLVHRNPASRPVPAAQV
jgi:uncharacterized protein involved in exopolysaccharide biosynthesis